MTSATLVLLFPADVTLRLPVEYSLKHFNAEQVDAPLQSIADKLGATMLYIDYAQEAT